MNKKEEFKIFVKQNPILIRYVKDGSMSWQKFYEIFDLYGEEESAWSDFIKKEEVTQTSTKENLDLFTWLKSVDLDSMQNGMNSLQRVLGLLGELTTKESVTPSNTDYKPRPLYKHFED